MNQRTLLRAFDQTGWADRPRHRPGAASQGRSAHAAARPGLQVKALLAALRFSGGPARTRGRAAGTACGGLALCALLLSACMMPGPPDTTLFESPDCTETYYLGLDGLRPAAPVDAIQLRQRNLNGPLVILSSSGNECMTATDPSGCAMKLATAATTPGFHPCPGNSCGRSLATTTGDTVKAYTDSKALSGFLGLIDTPMDAVLFVYAQGYNVSCIDKSIGSVRAALDGDGYEVLASLPEPGCNPYVLTGYQLRVTSRGGLTYLSRWPVQLPPGLPCE